MNTTARTLPAAIRQSCAQYADRAAIIDGDYRASYAQLLPLIEQAASALIALGVQAGERVAVWAPNVYEWIIAACGTHMAGAVLVPINTRMKGLEANDILERSGCKVLFSIGDFLGSYYPDMLAEGRPAIGRGWIGITPREAYVTTDVNVVALLPPWAWLLLAAGLAVLAWLVEGRKGAKA